IAPGQEAAFEQHLAALRARQPRAASVHLITQPRSTDTLAVDEDGELLRDAAGHLLLRPGGHGSLLQLLPAAGSWLLLRNIDNILPPGPRRQETASWRQALLGRLVELAAAIDRYTMAVA